MNRFGDVLDEVRSGVVLVYDDTSTTFMTVLACFYKQITICYVEAGLLTYNIYSLHPEKLNCQVVSVISKYNFVLTELSKVDLVKEVKTKARFTLPEILRSML